MHSRPLVSPLLDDDIDALYDLPPAEFTAARDALVKRLRAEKRRDEANEVKSLRRPSVAAWAVNQVARRHPQALESVLDAGTQLATAQRRALSGIKDAGLQPAAARRREAIQQAWELAAGELESAEAGAAAQRQAVVGTLEAASVDEDAAALVRAGRLTKELSAPADFGTVSGFALVGGVSGEDEEGDQRQEADEGASGDSAARNRQRNAEQAAAKARERAEDAQEQAGDARQAAVRATAEAQRLGEQAVAAAQRAAEAAEAAEEQEAKAQELEAAATAAAQEAAAVTAEAEALADDA